MRPGLLSGSEQKSTIPGTSVPRHPGEASTLYLPKSVMKLAGHRHVRSRQYWLMIMLSAEAVVAKAARAAVRMERVGCILAGLW